jgi:hypothetical protein
VQGEPVAGLSVKVGIRQFFCSSHEAIGPAFTTPAKAVAMIIEKIFILQKLGVDARSVLRATNS